VEVTYWDKYTDFEAAGLQKVVDAFNNSQTRIHVTFLSVSDIKTKTLMATAGGNPPDIAGLFGPDIAQYADAHALLPLDDYCKQAGIGEAQFLPIFWYICNYRGHTYALPSAAGTTALHYNTTAFREAGLDPNKPPRTIEELDAYSEKLTKRAPNGTLQQIGFVHADPGWWNWGWGYLFGGSLWDGKSKITANSPENVRAFTWAQSYCKKYGLDHLESFKSGFGNFSSPQNPFLAKKVAMQIQGNWMDNFVRKFAPDVKYAVAPFPYPKDRPDLADSTFADTDILVIPKGAQHPKEAFEFIRYMNSQTGKEMLATEHHSITPLSKVSAEFYKKHPHPYIRLFADLPRHKNNYFPPKLGIWRELENEMNSAFEEIMLLKSPPKEALDRVTSRMQPKLDAYLKMLALRNEDKP
jgi:ABC-type glycerol-3-phosphate transport system substrate-binding protein